MTIVAECTRVRLGLNTRRVLPESVVAIRSANDKGGDKYVVEERAALRKALASLRLAVAKTSAEEKTELPKTLEKINPNR